MLTEKCRNQEEIITDLELREQEHQELEAESELLQQQIQATRWWLFPHLRGFGRMFKHLFHECAGVVVFWVGVVVCFVVYFWGG